MNQELKNFQVELEVLESKITNNPDEIYDDEFYNIENQFEQIRHFQYNEFDMNVVKNIQKRLERIRIELDIYDEEGERDSMFPNGEDE